MQKVLLEFAATSAALRVVIASRTPKACRTVTAQPAAANGIRYADRTELPTPTLAVCVSRLASTTRTSRLCTRDCAVSAFIDFQTLIMGRN